MTQRYIFTTNRPSLAERLADLAIALAIAAGITLGLMIYFDVLTK